MADQDLDLFAETTSIEDTDLIAVYKKSSDSLWRDMTGANLRGTIVLDEDNFVSDSATKAPSQQSTKEFINRSIQALKAATDTGTDVYEVNLGMDLTSGDTFSADFGSANTTASPTLENTGGAPSGAQSIVDVDGNARIGMIEARPHKVQWDGTNFVLLDPQPLRPSTTSVEPSLAFDTWRTPNADRPTWVTVNAGCRTNGTTAGWVTVEIDESGGTTLDYTLDVVWSDEDISTVADNRATASFFLPAGGSYLVRNKQDPLGVNAIRKIREFTL